MKRIFLLFIIPFHCLAQPANDICSGATPIPTDGTCLTGQTTVAAGDHWIGQVGFQAGNNVNEVWYSFVATGTQTDITVTQGTMTGNIEVIVVEDASPPCGTLSNAGSNCAPGPTTTTTIQNLVIGATYYITVNGTGTDGTFDICNLNTTPPPTPGQDCPTAFTLCSADGFTVGSISSGAGTISGNGSNEDINVNSCFGGDERQSQWYTFTVDEDGDLEFQIDPAVFTDDYDWAVYNITRTGCVISPETPIACNWSFCSGMTGLTSNVGAYTGGLASTNDYEFGNPAGAGSCDGAPGGPDNGNGSSQWENPVNLVAGRTYAILIDNFSTTNSGFDFTWTGTDAEIGPDATFGYTLDATCFTVTLDRLTNYTGANMTYLWTFGDGTTSTDAVPAPHTYSTIGLYTISLEVTDAIGCVRTFSLQVDVGCLLLSNKLTSFNIETTDQTNFLEWSMEDTDELDYFQVQRSVDGLHWNDIAEVSAVHGELNYDFVDADFTKNTNNYYRIKLISTQGQISYSDIRVVDNVAYDMSGLFVKRVFPSPVQNMINIELSTQDIKYIQVEVLDLMGNLHSSNASILQQGTNFLQIDLENLESGVYLLSLTDEHGYQSQLRKFIKR